MTYELKPIYDSRASFYGKAHVITDGTTQKLYSYNTHVLTEDGGKITYLTTNPVHYTATTCRHINEFLRQRCGIRKTKAELLKMAQTIPAPPEKSTRARAADAADYLNTHNKNLTRAQWCAVIDICEFFEEVARDE